MKYLSKKGVSAVIATVMLILLALVLIGVVWVVVNDLVNERLDESQSCFDIFEKVTLNDRYTCYDQTLNEMHFSINVDDIEIDSAVVSISVEGQRKSVTLMNEDQLIPFLKPYLGAYTDNVSLPEKNAGKTYVYNLNGFTEKPDAVEIAPTIGGNQCDVSDSILEVVYCT